MPYVIVKYYLIDLGLHISAMDVGFIVVNTFMHPCLTICVKTTIIRLLLIFL